MVLGSISEALVVFGVLELVDATTGCLWYHMCLPRLPMVPQNVLNGILMAAGVLFCWGLSFRQEGQGKVDLSNEFGKMLHLSFTSSHQTGSKYLKPGNRYQVARRL